MLGRKMRKNLHLIISWVLIVMMIVSSGVVAALQDGFSAEPYDGNNTDGAAILEETLDADNGGDDPGGDPNGNNGGGSGSGNGDPNGANGAGGDDDDPNGTNGAGGDDDPNGGAGGGSDDPNGDPNGSGGDPIDPNYPTDPDYPNGDDDPIDDGRERYIIFELDINPVEIEDITTIGDPMAFLLHGVRALDESGENVEVSIQCHGDSLLDDGRFNLEMLLPGAYFTVVYAAAHPVTDEVFTTYRIFYISNEIVHALRFYFAEGAGGVTLEYLSDIGSPMQFLHEGVTVLDENNVSIAFAITDFDRILLEENGRYYFNLELMQPGEIFTLTYSATHPMTGDVFTAQRMFYVSAAFMSHRVILAVDEYHVRIDNIHDIENPVEFLLTGISAVDENDEELAVEIIDAGGLLIDSANIVEIDGYSVFVSMGTELPSEDGTKSTDEGAYCEDSVFNLEEIRHYDEFVVTFKAVHPEDPAVYETVERVFLVALNERIIRGNVTNVTVNVGERVRIEDGAVVTGTVTVSGTLIMHGGVIQGPNLAIPPVRVVVNNNGIFHMTGGVIRGHTANAGTFGVRVNAGGTFVMGQCIDGCLHCNPPVPAGIETVSAGGNPVIIGHNADTRPAVLLAGANSRFDMHGGSIQLITNINARGVRIDNGTFNMFGGEIRNISPHPATGADPDPVYGNNNVPTASPIHDSGNDRGIGVDMRGGIFNMGCEDGCAIGCAIHTPTIHGTATAVNLTTVGNPTFNMSGGEIFDNRTGSTNRSPGVNILHGTFNMHNGVIRDNFQTWAANVNDGGAGVRLMNNTSHFHMHGGIIHDNTHLGGIGGGVHVRSGANFTMHDGTISRNTTGRVDTGAGGGGVAVIDAHFIMHDGMIRDNRTRTSGGGVAVHGTTVASATFTMHGGTITDNEATNNRTGIGIGGAGYYSGGGGVWAYRATFTMNNGNITHNRTGGYWNSWRGAPTVPVSASTTFRAPVPDIGEHRTSDAWNALFEGQNPLPAAGTGGQNQNGGGVLALRNARFNMSGGTISYNVAGDLLRPWQGDWNRLPRGGTYHGGGGIATRNNAIVTITGGEITHNRSPAGGGIYVDNWSQVTIGGYIPQGEAAARPVHIKHNVAYSRLFTNLLGWDGRGGGGIATGDGLYYGDRFNSRPANTPLTGNQIFDEVHPNLRHNNTALCILDGTVIMYNISGGDGGGIYWWASSAVRMDDERYLHGLRVLPGATVENNLALVGDLRRLPPDFRPLTPDDSRLGSIYGRIDDGLNDRHNLTPRRRVATAVVRNGRVNPGGMWLDVGSGGMAEHTHIRGTRRIDNQPPPGNIEYTDDFFAGYGHHAFNNHDIRTVGGARWRRPTAPPQKYDPMQQINQGRVQLEVVGTDGGAPVQGSDTAFPYVHMGNLQVSLNFSRTSENPRDLLPEQPPIPTPDPPNPPNAQVVAFRHMQEELGGFPLAPLPDPITIRQVSGGESQNIRSAAVHVYNILPSVTPHDIVWVDRNGNVVAAGHEDAFRRVARNADGTHINAQTHHGTNVALNITTTDGGAPSHRVTKVEVFAACGCRVVDSQWINVVRPLDWVEGDPIPDGWAPGPYLIDHYCLTHHTGIDLRPNPITDEWLNWLARQYDVNGSLPIGLQQPHVGGVTPWPSPGDRFYHKGCLACRDEHPSASAVGNLLINSGGNGNYTLTHNHMLEFLTLGKPYLHRPGAGFGAYGLVFRVTVEPIREAEELRLGVIGGSIDFGTHNLPEVLSRGDEAIGLVQDRTRDVLSQDRTKFVEVQVFDDYGNPLRNPDDSFITKPELVPNGTDPREIGFTIRDSRRQAPVTPPPQPAPPNRSDGWHVTVQAEGDGDGIFSSMLRLHDGNPENPNDRRYIGGAAAVILNNLDADNANLSVCDSGTTAACSCSARVTRVTWADLIRINRDIVVCMDINPDRVPPMERHRAVITWTVKSGELPES